MLINVAVENFRSFDEKQELYMIASENIKQPEKYSGHCVDMGGIKLLKTAAVYGANAAGKSNFVSIFKFINYALRHNPSKTPLKCDDYCKSRTDNAKRESSFAIEFTTDRTFYEYGFSAVLSKGKVNHEWLLELLPDGNARQLFTREGGLVKIGTDLKISEAELNRINVYLEDFEGNESKLFLENMNNDKKIDGGEKSGLSFFKDAYTWIMSRLLIVDPNSRILDMRSFYDKNLLNKISETMRSFDTGIDKIRMRRASQSELEKATSKEFAEEVIEQLKTFPGLQIACGGTDSFFIINMNKEGEPKISTLEFTHMASDGSFSYTDESDGTKKLMFGLLDILLKVRPNTTYVVDEPERSLHPKLTENFIRSFLKTYEGINSQLIVATHENTIMSIDNFRRDEIWLVEKNSKNVSIIYPLDTFTDIYDDELGKAYLEGRYGAVPVFERNKGANDVLG